MRDDVLGSVEERVRCRAVAEAHFVAELSNDPDVIMTSMKSAAPLFTTIVIGADSDSPRLVHCATPEEQRSFYAAGRAHAHMSRVDLFTSVGGDWYGFVHGIVTSTALADSEVFSTELVGLLPTTPDEDTVAGEVGLGWPLLLGKPGDAPGDVARERVETVRVHDQWLDALRHGDAQRLADLYAPRASVAVRHPVTGAVICLEGRDAVAGFYRELLGEATVTGVDVVLRVVDRWFVFSEVRLRLHHHTAGRPGDPHGRRVRDRAGRHHPRAPRFVRRPGISRGMNAPRRESHHDESPRAQGCGEPAVGAVPK